MSQTIGRNWMYLIPGVVVALLYLSSLGFGFVWDDTIFLRDIPLYRESSTWLTAFNQPFALSPNYYRPLPLLTFMAELRLFGLNPLVFHLTNLVLHTINTSLVTLVALRLIRATGTTRASILAIAAGLLYGLHPALIEGVVFISSRFDLLLTFFLLLALLADVLLKGWQRPVLVGVFFFLAALSKEMALAFVLVLPFWHLTRRADFNQPLSLKEGMKKIQQHGDLAVYAAVFLAGLAYLGVRYAGLGYLLSPQAESSARIGTVWQQVLLVGLSLAEFIKLIFWPFGTLTPIHYSELPVSTQQFAGWAAWVAVLLVVMGLIYLLRKQTRFSLLTLASLAALLPVSNILPIELGGGAFVAERFLLFPLVLVILSVVVLLDDLGWNLQWRRNTRLLLWLLVCAGTIQLTVPHWRDNLSLWQWAAERAPQSAMPYTNLALEYNNLGNFTLGLAYAEEAIQRDPREGNAWNNAGLAFFGMQRYEESIDAFSKAIDRNPEDALYWNNLAGAYRELGEFGEAERILLDNVLPLNPELPVAFLNLGILYLQVDRPDLASLALQDAVALLPADLKHQAEEFLRQVDDPQRWLQMAEGMLANQALQEALQAFQQAGALGADPTDVWLGISTVLMTQGDWDQAKQILQQTLQDYGGDARVYYNLGVIGREQGDLEGAKAYFIQATLLAPDWELPQQALGEME